ncbi:filamentous hemagglutinin N-terminal domain-containing protein [Candidatus Parabeggiatoa sp. HSG14]|uniref:two-partner secretion domain-containing protein n=1 Tax=Candidatus Parabeggiatoa sp. HSG14 TaxID=3055593 RepID=UPI0025A8CE57|nr:filamentous hemagglutinin N-terminal domain-containing protein [Thiotrichales bacterium HSG14]
MCKYNLSEKICWLISLIIAGCIFPSYAEITLDGSFGTTSTLPGSDYMIGAELGSQAGNNLFHSFGEFNIEPGGSATFTGAAHIENIIGRVTGGNPSLINGALISNIPNADLYLLNPNGVMMGENASLNINGSFYLSSADYLRFADGQQFDTHFSTSPTLSVAAPQAFGFLDQNMGNLIIQNNQLSVPEGKDLSIVGRDIGITNSILSSFGGHISIASAKSAGEVPRADVMNNTLSQQGNIVIQGSQIINVGSPNFPQDNAVTISGGQIWLNSSVIQGVESTGDIEIASHSQLQIKSSILQTQNIQGQAGNFIFTAHINEHRG